MAGTQGTFRTSFNTSHVTLYLILRGLDSLYRVRFNTSHVTLYRPSSGLEKCSQDRFNTSHVTLYLIALQLVLDVWSFQYISCYSLSLPIRHVKDFDMEFQYISCYSLSKQTNKDEWFRGVSIHLMLLFIRNNSYYPMYEPWFQYISCYSLSLTDIGKSVWLMSFNTSHVTLYPKDRFGLVNVITFQYISCYSLS